MNEEEPEEDRDLLKFLSKEFDWTEEEAENWIATGEAPFREV